MELLLGFNGKEVPLVSSQARGWRQQLNQRAASSMEVSHSGWHATPRIHTAWELFFSWRLRERVHWKSGGTGSNCVLGVKRQSQKWCLIGDKLSMAQSPYTEAPSSQSHTAPKACPFVSWLHSPQGRAGVLLALLPLHRQPKSCRESGVLQARSPGPCQEDCGFTETGVQPKTKMHA